MTELSSPHLQRRACRNWDDELGCRCVALAPVKPRPQQQVVKKPAHNRRRGCGSWDEELGCTCTLSTAGVAFHAEELLVPGLLDEQQPRTVLYTIDRSWQHDTPQGSGDDQHGLPVGDTSSERASLFNRKRKREGVVEEHADIGQCSTPGQLARQFQPRRIRNDPVLQSLFSFGECNDSMSTSKAGMAGQSLEKHSRIMSAQLPADDRPKDGPLCFGKPNLQLIGQRGASPQTRWSYLLDDRVRRCFAAHMSCALDTHVAQRLMKEACYSTPWQQPEGRHGLLPRKTVWMVKEPCACTYAYAGLQVKPQPFVQWVQEAMEFCMPLCGFSDSSSWPNSCNLNLYENGSHSVAWHSDDERLFQGRLRDCTIISLSLGHARSFQLKRRCSFEKPIKILLSGGDLCTMEGMTQKYYVHRVPKETGVAIGPRVNLTWRWIKKHNKACPLASHKRRLRNH